MYSAVWKEKALLVKCGIEESMRGETGPDTPLLHDNNLYDKPTRGTSMDEFRAMLHSFLKVTSSPLLSIFHIKSKYHSKPDLHLTKKQVLCS